MENMEEMELDVNRILNQLLDLIKKNWIGFVIVLILSLGGAIMSKSTSNKTYSSTAILDSRGMVPRDILMESINDYFKSLSKNCSDTLIVQSIKSHKNRAGINENRFFLDLKTKKQISTELLAQSINDYVKSDKYVVRYLDDKVLSSKIKLKVIEQQIETIKGGNKSGFDNGINIYLELLEEKVNLKRQLDYALDYKLFDKGFSVPVLRTSIRGGKIGAFAKVFVTGLILLFIIAYLRSRKG